MLRAFNDAYLPEYKKELQNMGGRTTNGKKGARKR